MTKSHTATGDARIHADDFAFRKSLLNLSDTEVETLKALHTPLQAYEQDLIDHFYEHLMRFEHVRQMLKDPALLARLKESQRRYFRALTSGVYDEAYAEGRILVGVKHQHVGLTPQWYIGAYGVYLQFACQCIAEIYREQPAEISPAISALYKVVLFDITLAFDAYMQASQYTLEQAKNEITEKYDQQLKVGQLIMRIQNAFILDASYEEALEILLQELIALTQSEFGLIGDVLYTPEGAPYLKVKVLTNIAWSPETKALYDSNQADGLEFHNTNNLLGRVMTEGRPVISNAPATDARSGGIPAGHPKLNAFLGLPMCREQQVIGMIGLANAAAGYSQDTIALLQPIMDALESLMEASRIKLMLSAVQFENSRLALVARQTVNSVVVTNTKGEIQWCNDGFKNISGYTLEEVLHQKPWEILLGTDTDKRALSTLQNAMSAAVPIELDILKYKKNGEAFWLKTSCNPIVDDTGVHQGFVLVELDVTQTRKQSDALASFKSVLDQTLDAVLFFDAETLQITYANLGAQDQLGRSQDELLKLKPYEFKPMYAHESFVALLQPLLTGETSALNFVTWHTRGCGTRYPAEVSMQLVKTAFNQHIVVNVLRDISAELEFDRLRTQNEQRIATLLQKAEDPMGIISNDLIITDCNAAAAQLFGFESPAALIGLSPIDFSPEDQAAGKSRALAKLYIQRTIHEGYQRFEWAHKTANSTCSPIEVTLTPIIYLGSPCVQVVWRDLTEIKAKEQKIKQLAYFDELTGLANKNLFSDRVNYLLSLSKRQGYIIAVIYLELVNLEDIHETLGYAAGEVLIQAVSQRLVAVIRNADTLARYVFDDLQIEFEPAAEEVDREFDSLARINNGVFALAAVLTEPEGASVMVGRLQESLNQPFEVDGHTCVINSCAGIALSPQDAETFESLTRGANIALGQAKENRQHACFFNTKLGEEIQLRSVMSQRLEASLNHSPEDFSLRFQAQVDLRTRKLSGAEVLLRWRDAELGEVSPGLFIPLAEDRGLIDRITTLVLQQSNRQLVSWRQLGKDLQQQFGVRLAVNISAKTVDNTDLAAAYIALIQASDLSPQYYELELTETGLMRNPEMAICMLQGFRTAGFKLAVDDFGVGHSSLSYLKNIDADILKIDISFIRSMLTDEKSYAIVKTIISTAKIFGMKTLAEGIENEEVAQALEALGCDYGQGYHFSKPLTQEEFESTWLI